MTQPDLNELAREAAEAEIQDFLADTKDPLKIGSFVLSALTKLAAVKDAENQRFVNRLAKALDDLAGQKAALKIATDALTNMASNDPPCDNDGRGCMCCEVIAPAALQQIKELKP